MRKTYSYLRYCVFLSLFLFNPVDIKNRNRKPELLDSRADKT